MEISNYPARIAFSIGRLVVFFLGLIVFQAAGLAQSSITSTELLANQPAPAPGVIGNNLQFLKESKQSMPLVDQMEFRTETDELDIDRQELLFRMSFNRRKARKVQDELTKNNIQYYEQQAQLQQEFYLIDRYEQIVDWYYAVQELNLLNEKKIILEDKKTVYQKIIANSLEIEIDDLLSVEEDLQQLEREVLQLDYQKDYVIQQLFPDQNREDPLLNGENWITIETMESVLNTIEDSVANNLEQAMLATRTDFAQLEYDLKKAEAGQILDFVQMKYNGRARLDFYKEWSFGVAFNIPLKSSSRVRMNKAQMDVFEEQYEEELLDIELADKIREDYAEFAGLAREYKLVRKYISDNSLETNLKEYAGTIQPVTLLRVKENRLRNRLALQKIEKELCQLFLDILWNKGVLFQTPVRNYLSDDLPTF